MEIRKLKEMPYAQAHIEIDDFGNHTLVSGVIVVACVNTETGWCWCNGLYSATTRQHIAAFAKEFGLAYATFKDMVDNKLDYNCDTGEIIELEAEQ